MATQVVALTAPSVASGNECGSISKRQQTCFKPSHRTHVSCRLTSQFLGLPLRLSVHHEENNLSTPDLKGQRPLVVARLFGPAIFEASKLKVLFLGDGKDKRPDELPRAYTLTHSDITAKLTLAVSQSINKAQIQGWYNRLQRDEVLAEWKKSQGSMSLHVHCHISGGHWLLDTIAKLRFYIFRKELPVVGFDFKLAFKHAVRRNYFVYRMVNKKDLPLQVLEAFRYGDENLFNNHPGLFSPPGFKSMLLK